MNEMLTANLRAMVQKNTAHNEGCRLSRVIRSFVFLVISADLFDFTLQCEF